MYIILVDKTKQRNVLTEQRLAGAQNQSEY